MTIQTKIIAFLVSILAFIGALTGAYFKGHSDGAEAANKDCQIERQKEADAANLKIEEANQKIADIARELEEKKKKQQQNKGKTDASSKQETASNPVYSSCILPDSGVRHLADTATELSKIRNSGKPVDQVP